MGPDRDFSREGLGKLQEGWRDNPNLTKSKFYLNYTGSRSLLVAQTKTNQLLAQSN